MSVPPKPELRPITRNLLLMQKKARPMLLPMKLIVLLLKRKMLWPDAREKFKPMKTLKIRRQPL